MSLVDQTGLICDGAGDVKHKLVLSSVSTEITGDGPVATDTVYPLAYGPAVTGPIASINLAGETTFHVDFSGYIVIGVQVSKLGNPGFIDACFRSTAGPGFALQIGATIHEKLDSPNINKFINISTPLPDIAAGTTIRQELWFDSADGGSANGELAPFIPALAGAAIAPRCQVQLFMAEVS